MPSDLNNAIREQMAHLKDFSDGTSGIDVLNLQDDDGSASIKIQAPSAVTTTTTFTLPDGDGSSGQVLSTNGSGTLSWASAFSAGMLMPYAGASAPSGWLLCYGQAISRTTYAALFAIIGTTYGSGDGSTTFNVPDLRGRVIAGQDDMGGTSANRLTDQSGGLDGDTLGDTGGSETHTLTAAEMAHIHGFGRWKGTNDDLEWLYNNATWSGLGSYTYKQTLGEGGGDTGTISSGEATTTSVFLDGSDTPSAHNNVQPTIILNYIIKT